MPTTYAIIQGNKYMDATLYTGNGATQTVTNAAGFYPDFTWIKDRSTATQDHALYDSIRGAKNILYSNRTNAQYSDPSYGVTVWNSNGFTVVDNTAGNGNVNGAVGGTYSGAAQYVGWQWTANQGANVTNTSGTVTSTVSANTTSGFSVVKFNNPTSGTYTVGHGLGVAPKLVIIKYTTAVGNWFVYNANIGYTNRLLFNTTAGSGSAAYWTSAPTSTTVNFDTAFTDNPSQSLIMYCWAEVSGFSAFGSYTGNGSTDGPFVYTGFRPKWIMIKRTDTTGNWLMYDATRVPYNLDNAFLYANTADAEVSDTVGYDFLSNGFKTRNTYSDGNANGGTYVYAAFASTPFKYANAR